MLAAQREADYRLAYLAERKMEERLRDVYVAKQTHMRPPIFHEILEELVDIEAQLFVMHNKDAFSDLSDIAYAELQYQLDAEEPEALNFVFSRIDRRFVEMFAHDLFLMLMTHNYMFFEQDPYDKSFLKVHNSSIRSVW